MPLLIRTLYFAHVREQVGLSSETFEVQDGSTVQDVVNEIVARHPKVAALLPHVRVALDGEFVDLASPARAGELVLIPPVAGGAPTLPTTWLGPDPITPARVAALGELVAGHDRGAIVTFEGRVRDHARGRRVTALEYEAYAPMAERLMSTIVAEVERDHPGVTCALHHRVGLIPIGEVAVVALASHAHRGPAFEACQRLISRLKEDVPIWKRETSDDGTTWVSERP